MQPFLEIPQVITNNEQEQKEVIARIQPNEVAHYYPGFHWGTVVVMRSGYSCLLNVTVDELDSALYAYHSAVKSNSGKFGNLKLTRKTSKPLLHVAD